MSLLASSMYSLQVPQQDPLKVASLSPLIRLGPLLRGCLPVDLDNDLDCLLAVSGSAQFVTNR